MSFFLQVRYRSFFVYNIPILMQIHLFNTNDFLILLTRDERIEPSKKSSRYKILPLLLFTSIFPVWLQFKLLLCWFPLGAPLWYYLATIFTLFPQPMRATIPHWSKIVRFVHKVMHIELMCVLSKSHAKIDFVGPQTHFAWDLHS